MLIEFSENNAFKMTTFDICGEKQTDIKGDFCTFSYECTIYDAVVLCWVLQFFRGPKKGLDNALCILKPWGGEYFNNPVYFIMKYRPYDLYRFIKHGLEYLLSEFMEFKKSEIEVK